MLTTYFSRKNKGFIVLPRTFTFSPLITIVALGLSLLMLKASVWQWDRYKAKVALIESYKDNRQSSAVELPESDSSYTSLINRKVVLRGSFEYEHEMIVLNRRNAGKPGSLLLTPFKIDGREKRIIVSRGWIPFEDRDPESWNRYRETNTAEIYGVVQEGKESSWVNPSVPAGQSSGSKTPGAFQRQWLFPDLRGMAKQVPYPLEEGFLIQKLKGEEDTRAMPAEYVSFRVPPSTHFGYTIEWALLALGSLLIGFLLQAFPSFFFRAMRKEKRGEESPSPSGATIH